MTSNADYLDPYEDKPVEPEPPIRNFIVEVGQCFKIRVKCRDIKHAFKEAQLKAMQSSGKIIWSPGATFRIYEIGEEIVWDPAKGEAV